MGRIIAVCISVQKGTPKQNVREATLIAGHGIAGDAHAGSWHRQVSLLSWQAVEDFRARGAQVQHGCFGENLLVDGIDFASLPVGTRFVCHDAVLELTQVGKKCHNHCQIFKTMGECIMPTQGVFARVLRGGVVKVGDMLDIATQGTGQ